MKLQRGDGERLVIDKGGPEVAAVASTQGGTFGGDLRTRKRPLSKHLRRFAKVLRGKCAADITICGRAARFQPA